MVTLSSAFNVVKKSVVGKALDFTTVAFNHPIATTTSIIKGGDSYNTLVTKEFSKPLGQQVTGTVISTIGYGTAIVGGGAVAGAAKAGTLGTTALSIGKTLVPKTLAGKAIAAVTVPLVVTNIVSNPIKSAQTAGKGVDAYKDALVLASNPSISSGIDYVKEHPVASAAAGLITAAAVGKGVAGAVATTLNTQAVRENTQSSINNSLPLTTSNGDISSTQLPTSNILPQVPATQTLSSSKRVSGGKRRKKSILPSVNQRVNVIVQQRSNNTHTIKRYLNRQVLTH